MEPVIIRIYPMSQGGAAMEIENLPQFLVEGGEPAKQNLLTALEILTRHIRHGASLFPAVETIQ